MSNLFAWGLKSFYDIDVEELEQEISSLRQQVAGLNYRNKILQDTGLQDSKQIKALQIQVKASMASLDRYERKITSLRFENSELYEKLNKVIGEKNNSGKRIDGLSHRLAEIQQDNEHLQVQNNNLSVSFDNVRQITEKDQQIKEMECSLEEMRTTNSVLQSQVEDLSKQLEKFNQSPESIEQLKDQIEQLQKEKKDLEEGNKAVNEENASLKKDILNANTTLKNLGEQVKAVNASIESKNAQIEEVKSFLDNRIRELEDKEIEIAQLQEELKKINNHGKGASSFTIGESTPPVDHDENPYNGGTPCVVDKETGEEILAKDFFARSEADIFKTRTELIKAMLLNKPKYVCKYCGQMVKVSGVKLVKGIPLHFMHLSEGANCKYNIPDSREIRHGDGSGARHIDSRRAYLRAELEKLLVMTPGVSNIQVGKTVTALQHPLFGRKRPDLQVSYQGKNLVFELQLSSNYIANLTERDLFYRLEHKHVIRVFSFDKSINSLDLKSMTSKDVYFNSNLNIFIFDDEARKKSEEENELYLKCNWIIATENGDVWKYQNENVSDKLGGILIRLSDLTFEYSTYKPYYYDAEKEYYADHEELKVQYKQQANEENSIVENLEKNWKTPKQPEVSDVEKIKEAYNIDTIMKSTKSYVKGKSLGKCGLVTMDGVLRVPFEYDDIKTHYVVFTEKKHSGWTEAIANGLIDIYDADFSLKEKGIIRIDEIDGNESLKKYVKRQTGYLLWGLMDSRGNSLTNPIYSEIKSWSDKILAICDGKYRILDANGKIIVRGYDFIGQLGEDGTAEIRKKGRKGRINRYCKDIRTSVITLADGYQKVCINGKWGIEDMNGEEVIPFEYDDIGSFKGQLIGLNGGKYSILAKALLIDVPLEVKYKERGDTKKQIFTVGGRIAFMNLRQQQKAYKQGYKPACLTKAYISFINLERELLYLSACPIKAIVPIAKVKDKDVPIGTIWDVEVCHVNTVGIIAKLASGEKAYLHHSIWENRNSDSFSIGQPLRIEKTGFDQEHNKHVWKILDEQKCLSK